MSCAFVNIYENDLKKRSGSDLVKSALNSYLRRRHYMDADHFRKSELVLNQNCKQMTIAASIDKDVSRLNSISYSTTSNDITLAEQQFIKLKTWVTELPEGKCQHELYRLLFPLLCHLYLEILRGGLDRQTGSKFLKRHQELFVADHRDIIEELSQETDTKPLVTAFRSCKYEIKISSTTMAALQRFLASHGHVILLQVLQTWFDIEMTKDDNVIEMEDEQEDITSDENADYLERLYQQTPGDKDMRTLQDCIKLIRACPTPPPPLLLYTLNNSEGVCCAKVSQSGKLLASGYSSSELKMWSLSECKINSPALGVQAHIIQEQKHTSLRGHFGPITGVEFLNEVFLSVSYDGTMRAWRLTDFSPAAIYRGHNYPIWCVSTSSLGVYVATGSHDRTARIWSLDRTYPIRMLAGHTDDVNCVQFHPNGNYLATGSADRTIRLWSVTDGNLVRVYSGNSSSILAVAFSPNGQYLASAGDDRKVKVWDLATGGVLAELKGHCMPVTSLDWSMDSSILASASLDGTILLWDTTVHFKPNSETTDISAKYTTNCTSILSLQNLMRGNLVAVGVH